MNQDDEEPEKEREDAPLEDEKAEPEEEPFPESFRESILRVVDDALREALEIRRKGKVLKMSIGDELARIKRDVKRAVEGATATIAAVDLEALKEGLRGRTNTLMTRVKDEDLKRIDLLVEAGLFESRSECAAFLIHAGLEARRDLVGKVQETARRISELKEQLRRELSGEDQEESAGH